MEKPTTAPRAGKTFAAAGARRIANQMFSRASGAQLREGNCVRLLKDAAQNYPAWFAAIGGAQQTIHVEMYIIHEDALGRQLAEALLVKAGEGVRVRLLYDWMGGLGSASRRFWNQMRAGGIEVRCYNPPRFDSPLGWLSRDHRKLITVDSMVGFVTGLCVGQAWVGDPAAGVDPWRDTGVEMRGPAVADLEDAFAEAWASAGEPLPSALGRGVDGPSSASPLAVDDVFTGVALRVVATEPNEAGLFRVDQLVAAIARHSLWLTDAYYAGTTPYVQALRAAVQDGVDVRLLVPGTSDLPTVGTLSRAGYRPLLEAGVRVFEWNGSMLHAKTAVADATWARVGSTNLNVASWMGNRELDVIIEDGPFAQRMAEQFLEDLGNATEVVLGAHNRVSRPGAPARRRRVKGGGGSGGHAVAGALRIGSAVSAAMTNRRVLGPVEAHIALASGSLLVALALVAFLFPRSLAYPVAALSTWLAVALLVRGVSLLRQRHRRALNPGVPPSDAQRADRLDP